MTRRFLSLLASLAAITPLFAELPLPVAPIDREEPVDYAQEILPILKRNCLACHFEQEPEGGLSLETHESLLRGGDSGTGIVPGDLDKSAVWLRASGTEEPLMPPEDNGVGAKTLTPEELGLLKQWIQQGAVGADRGSTAITWQPVPESVHPVYAVAVSADGKWLARGRGNQVAVFELATGEPVATLVDSELTESMGREGTDIDLVQSVAFSPLGDQIATGGFRTVKLWRKSHRQLESSESPLASAGGLVASDGEGKRWAWINAIGDVEIWEPATDQPTGTLPGHGSFPIGLSISDSGERLMTGGADGRLTVWDLAGERVLAELDAERSLLASALSPDGRVAAVITAERALLMWRLTGNDSDTEAATEPFAAVESEPLKSLTDVTAIAFAANPKPEIAIGMGDGRVTVFDCESLTQQRVFEHGAPVDAIAVNREGTRLASAGRDGVTRMWNFADGSAVRTLDGDPGHQRLIATAERNHTRQVALLKRLEARTGEIEAAIKQEQEAVAKVQKARDDAAEKVAADEQKRKAAEDKVKTTESEIDQQKLRAKEAAERIEKLKQEIAEAQKKISESQAAIEKAKQQEEKLLKQLEADRKSLSAAAETKTKSQTELEQRQQTLDTAQEAQRRVAARLPVHQARIGAESRRAERLQRQVRLRQDRASDPAGFVTDIAFSPDGQWLGTRHRDGSARIYREGQSAAIATLRPDFTARSNAAIAGDDSLGFMFGPEQSGILFSGSSPASVWKLIPQWRLERTIGALEESPISDRVMALDFHPEGLAIAVGGGPPSRFGEVKLFSAVDGRVLRDFGTVHSDTVFGIGFSPDGESLVSSAADKTVRLLDVATGEVVRSLEGHTHHVLGVAWHDNGETLVSASADQTVKVWNVETGGQRRTIGGFPKEVTAVRFVADSGRIVTACADGQVRVYNSDDGKQVRSFNVSPDFLFALAVTPDGKTLVAGGQTGTVQVWNVEDGKLLYEIR